MFTRRGFLKFLVGLGAAVLPWYGWSKTLVGVIHIPVELDQKTSIAKTTAHKISKLDHSFLQRTAMDDILVLTQPKFQGRKAGSVGEELAASYLTDQLRGLRLEPLGDLMENNQRNYSYAFTIYPVVERFEEFQFGRHLTFAPGNPDDLRTPSANIIGALMGTNKTESVILSAHYDHLGIFQGNLYPGANDNASGVGCILDVIRRLVREGRKPKLNVIIAFWSAEEMGFVGSYFFIKNPTVPKSGIKAVFNVDTVGNGSLSEFALWANKNNEAAQIISTAAISNQATAILTPNYDYNSDQFYFDSNNIPAVTLMAKDWLDKNHTPDDTSNLVNPKKLILASNILYSAVSKLIFD